MPNPKYANRAYFDVTESAANTLTFAQVQTGIQAFSKIAWVIHRIDWYTGNINQLTASPDRITGAICGSNKFTTIDIEDPSVYAYFELGCLLSGTAANLEIWEQPYTMDYSTFPGGGLIVPGYPLFIAVAGTSLSGAVHLTARVWYETLELKPDEYIQLVEALRMIE